MRSRLGRTTSLRNRWTRRRGQARVRSPPNQILPLTGSRPEPRAGLARQDEAGPGLGTGGSSSNSSFTTRSKELPHGRDGVPGAFAALRPDPFPRRKSASRGRTNCTSG